AARPVVAAGDLAPPPLADLVDDGRRRELLPKEPAEPARLLLRVDRLEPPAKERLAFVVDEDVRSPEGMLDELESLRRDCGREPADALEPGEDVVVARAIGVAHQRGVHP